MHIISFATKETNWSVPRVGFLRTSAISTRKPPVFLKPGDQMEVLIEGMGGLGNPVVGESDQ